jgi:ribosomal protein S9
MAGKPPGARHRFSAAFLQDLADVWQAHGRETMIATARVNPSTFFAVCARLIPSDVKISVEQTFGGLSAEDYAILQGIKEALPAANSQNPADVLAYVRDTLRAADAQDN